MKKIETVKEINMTVIDDSYFQSLYSLKDKPVISSDVADFLENTAREFKPFDKFKLNIYSDTIYEEDKSVYKKSIHNYYTLRIKELKHQMRQKTILASIFLLIGLAALVVMFIYLKINNNEIGYQLIQIFSWVFIWEAVHIFFIERRSLTLAMRRYMSLSDMDVNFYKLTKEGTNDQQPK
ncbi:MAG: hypothetical protein J6X02_00750 [Bacilli bacterium]|nr:hypothetical protein [Bacilli bacterium]